MRLGRLRLTLALVLGLALTGCADSEADTTCLPREFFDAVEARVDEPLSVDRCANDVIDVLDAAVVAQASADLADAAHAYAAGGPAVAFSAAIEEAAGQQGWFVHGLNVVLIEAAGADADDVRAAATDRFDDGRGRAGVLTWDALRGAEVATGRTDLLTDAQRATWREAVGDPPDAALTAYADLSADQRDALRRADLDIDAPAEGAAWGQDSEQAFVAAAGR